MRNGLQIIEDVFIVIDISPVKDEITGEVWKKPAPLSTGKEDIIISCTATNNEPIEQAEVIVNIHVPSITVPAAGHQDIQPDFERLRLLSGMVENLLNGYQQSEFSLQLIQPGIILQDEKTNGFYSSIKVNYYSENGTTQVVFLMPVKTKNSEGGVEVGYPVNSGNITANAVVKTTGQAPIFEAGIDSLEITKEVEVRDIINWQPIDKDWIMRHGGADHAIFSKELQGNHFVKFVVKAKAGSFASAVVVNENEGEGEGGGDGGTDTTGPTLTVTVAGEGNFQFYANKTVTVDWGDGSPVQAVTSSNHYYTGGPFDLIIYHHNQPEQLVLASNFIDIHEVVGSFPTSLQKFSAQVMGITDIPELPATIKELRLAFDALTTAAMDDIIQQLADGAVSNGTLALNDQTTNETPSNTDGINTLSSRGWDIDV